MGSVKDITEATFEADVVERSRTVPVVVDFWAPWCGPCRTLGPILEREVEALGGRVEMVKVNTDANPNLASAFNITSIPAVKGFRNGEMVFEFLGAQPIPIIREFLASLAPSESARLLTAAIAAMKEGRHEEAQATLRGLLGDQAQSATAAFHLGHLLVGRGGRAADIKELAERVPATSELSVRAETLLALAEWLGRAEGADPQVLRAQVDADPKDHDARLALASAQLARGDTSGSLDTLLESVSRNPRHADGAARKAMLAVFDHLEEPGQNPDLAREYRRKLQIVL
jgi:putative thioredoxin